MDSLQFGRKDPWCTELVKCTCIATYNWECQACLWLRSSWRPVVKCEPRISACLYPPWSHLIRRNSIRRSATVTHIRRRWFSIWKLLALSPFVHIHVAVCSISSQTAKIWSASNLYIQLPLYRGSAPSSHPNSVFSIGKSRLITFHFEQ